MTEARTWSWGAQKSAALGRNEGEPVSGREMSGGETKGGRGRP